MAKEINPFLMFPSGAETAMNFYLSLFPGAQIESLTHYGAEGPGVAGSVKQATLLLLGRRFEFFDSPVRHAFTFTPRSLSPSLATMSRKSTGFSWRCRTGARC